MYHASLYEQALEACKFSGEWDSDSEQAPLDPDLQQQFTKLKAAVQYCCEETADAKCLLENCSQYDPDIQINRGCIEFKTGHFQEAQQHFETAAKSTGFEPRLWYNRAVTAYKRLDIPRAAHFIGW